MIHAVSLLLDVPAWLCPSSPFIPLQNSEELSDKEELDYPWSSLWLAGIL